MFKRFHLLIKYRVSNCVLCDRDQPREVIPADSPVHSNQHFHIFPSHDACQG